MSLFGDTIVRSGTEITTLFAQNVKCDELIIDSKDYIADCCKVDYGGTKVKPLYINNSKEFAQWFNQIVSTSRLETNQDGFVDKDYCSVWSTFTGYGGGGGGEITRWSVNATNYKPIEIGRRTQHDFSWDSAYQTGNTDWEKNSISRSTGVWSLQTSTHDMGYYDTSTQFVKLMNYGFNGYGCIYIRLNGTTQTQNISKIKGVDIEAMKYNNWNTDVFRITNGSEIYIINDSDIELEVGCGTTQYEYGDTWLNTPKGTIFGNKYVPPYGSAVLVYYAPFFYVNNGYYGGYGKGTGAPYGGWDRND